MSDSWKDDNCAAIKAHHAVYSVPHAAALWCAVPEDELELILKEATQLSTSGSGRGVWIHPAVPCLKPRTIAIAEAIETGLLPYGREDAKPVGDHVAYERRHVLGKYLKKWMEEAFPNDKPTFLFDDIERDSHTSISAKSYRTLQADRDALKVRVEKAIEAYSLLRDKNKAIEAERDLLKKQLEGISLPNKDTDNTALLNSEYWGKLSGLACHAIQAYPDWKANQRKIQKTGNLQDWLTIVIKADSREAEIIKKILSDFFQDLR